MCIRDRLHTDKGLIKINSLTKNYNIYLCHTENEEKSAIIERFSRTQKKRMKVIFEINKNYKRIDILEKTVKEYNNTIHRTIGMKPLEVNKEKERK